MTAPLRARVYRPPNIDVTGLDQTERVTVHAGWTWQLWSGDPHDGGQLIDWGTRDTQPNALTAACHHLRRRSTPCLNHWPELGRWGTP